MLSFLKTQKSINKKKNFHAGVKLAILCLQDRRQRIRHVSKSKNKLKQIFI